MSDKLNGSFSGLWTCELCGKTGTACTCEHFNRGTGAWGRLKTLTEPETAAEYWKALYNYAEANGKKETERSKDRMEIWKSFVHGKDPEADDADIE